jgi:prepilin-type N-terminal cleavage/methylation domain-containing protein
MGIETNMSYKALKNRLLSKGGFTLIEMIMTITILGIVSLVGFGFISNSTGVFFSMKEETKISNEAWVAVERIVRELQCAGASTNATAPALGAVGSTLTFTASYKTACAGCIDKSSAISYTLSNGQLLRTTATMANQVLADGITAFTVTRTTGNVFTISLTKTNGKNTITFSETVYPYPNPTTGYIDNVV